MQSYDVYITYLMNHMWVIGAFFKKWVIVHYSRMESKFQNLKPYNIYFNYADFKFLDQNLRSWPSFEKLSPTFFATSNFETRLSRDPITWHPEVRCFGYKMTHFIILPPQKNFSRTLQILGFIAESGHCKCGKWHSGLASRSTSFQLDQIWLFSVFWIKNQKREITIYQFKKT